MKVEVINGVMTVETSVNEILKRAKSVTPDQYYAGLDYICPFIGAMGLARLRRKSFTGIMEMKHNELIDVCDRKKAAEMCIQLLANAGASQKYLASYRRHLRECEFKVTEDNVVTASGRHHAILDDEIGGGTANSSAFDHFRERIDQLGKENNPDHIHDHFHDHFRIGILLKNIERGHGDDAIVMQYDLN